MIQGISAVTATQTGLMIGSSIGVCVVAELAKRIFSALRADSQSNNLNTLVGAAVSVLFFSTCITVGSVAISVGIASFFLISALKAKEAKPEQSRRVQNDDHSALSQADQHSELVITDPDRLPSCKGISICPDTFSTVLSFLEPQELARSESVCKEWNQSIRDEWKTQFQIQLGLSSEINPERYLPEGLSYKRSVELMSSCLLATSVYRHYIGEIGPITPIPEAISFKKCNEPDPCDPTKTIGREYVWMYCPSHIETDLEGFSLDKPDDPNDLEAPRLIFNERARPGVKGKALKVPITINNIVELFKRPKTGNPSAYSIILSEIAEQHGNKRIPAGWICMRKNVIGRNLSFAQQQALAAEKGVIISQLLHRILFNFLEHVRSSRANFYPDGRDPWTFARTSTPTLSPQGNAFPSGCAGGGPSGLGVHYDAFLIGNVLVGLGVGLPEEVQAIGP